MKRNDVQQGIRARVGDFMSAMIGRGDSASLYSRAIFLSETGVRSPHHSCGESGMRTSEPKPHQNNNLLVSFDSVVRNRKVPWNDANFGIGTLDD